VTTTQIALVAGASLLAAYAAFVLILMVAGRREAARAVAGFVPDCAVLFGRLARDPHVPRWRRALLVALALYLASPIDLVPDFIPIAGQLDDAILVLLGLRSLVHGGGERVCAHWPGPRSSLDVILRLGGIDNGCAPAAGTDGLRSD
jgi:uncharacterized membrane protein YkvA (DUF1232 family)